MSKEPLSNLCSLLLKEYFGEIVGKVGTFLLKGSNQLKVIARGAEVTLDETRKALCVLLQHDFTNFKLHDDGYVEYQALKYNIVLLVRYPRYIVYAKTIYGDLAELIIAELLLNGHLCMSNAMRKVLTIHQATGQGSVSAENVKDVFVMLVEAHLVVRCPSVIPDDAAEVPEFETFEDLYQIPDILLPLIEMKQEPAEMQPTDIEQLWPDRTIYWKVNFEAFHAIFRHEDIAKLNNEAVFEDEHVALYKVAEATAISVVQEKFGRLSARLFRALLDKGYATQRQLAKIALVSEEDVNRMTFDMMRDSAMQIHEKKVLGYKGYYSTYQLHVNMEAFCRTLLDRSYKAVANAMIRRAAETEKCKKLRKIKKCRDVKLSPSETAELENVRRALHKLGQSELDVDRTIFALKSWLDTFEFRMQSDLITIFSSFL